MALKPIAQNSFCGTFEEKQCVFIETVLGCQSDKVEENALSIFNILSGRSVFLSKLVNMFI